MERAREKIPRLDGEARGGGGGGGGGCTTKDGEKRSLFYSGGARPAIWSYKINHSSSPAVGATRQINRSSASYELTRNFNPTSPTSLILSLSISLSFFLAVRRRSLSRLLSSFRIREINPSRDTLTRSCARRSERERIKKDEGPRKVAHNAPHCAYVARFLPFEDVSH